MIAILQCISYFMTVLISTSFYITKYSMRCRILLYAIFCCICFSLGDVLGQLITPLFLLIGILITVFTTKNRILNVILFELGWFWFVISDYIVTIPMWIIGYPIVSIQSTAGLCTIYIILHCLVSLLPAALSSRRLRMYVYPELTEIPVKAQVLLCIDVSICCCIFVFNIIYGSFHDFEQGTIFFNGLIFTLYLCCSLIIFYLLYKTMHENKLLELDAARKENLLSYTNSLEEMYQNMRIFRHDYLNILSTMKCYIDTADMPALEHYFNEKILPASSSMTSQDFVIGKLALVKILELKSILYVKLVQSMQCGLKVSIELAEEISDISMDSLKLCNILGILLDNAIEASCDSSAHTLHIALITEEQGLLIHIENSSSPITVPIEQLYQPGYSRKHGSHSGIGLFQVRRIIEELPNVFLGTSYADGIFIQELEIQKSPHNVAIF